MLEDSLLGALNDNDASTIINSFRDLLEKQHGLDHEFDIVIQMTKRTLLARKIEFPEEIARIILDHERVRRQ